ncbi:hypothetical protein E1266_36480, partial [Actinomadura sp. 7K534]
ARWAAGAGGAAQWGAPGAGRARRRARAQRVPGDAERGARRARLLLVRGGPGGGGRPGRAAQPVTASGLRRTTRPV